MNFIEEELYVADSQLPNSGKGLFTKKQIRMGEPICEFRGRLIGGKDFQQIIEQVKKGTFDMKAADYYISLSSGLILDSSASDCFARYANDAEGFKAIEGFENNAKIKETENKLGAYLVAIKDIPSGSEIFTSYGASYWKGFGNEKISSQNQ